MVPARPPIPHPSRLADELVADTETMRGAGVRCLSSIGSLGIWITTGWEGSMIGSKLALNLAMALCLCILVCSSAWAFDLTGAWATAEAACPKVFLKDGNKVSLTADSDIYGGGFIVDGNQIVGKNGKMPDQLEEGGWRRFAGIRHVFDGYNALGGPIQLRDRR